MSVTSKITRTLQYAAQEISLRTPTKPGNGRADDVIVSLTSYPARIGTAWKTLETIFRQSVLPSEVVLVLSSVEFPRMEIPASVSRFKHQGLRVVFVDNNIRSYKKLVPVMSEYGNKAIITVDDDVLYPHHWLRDLINAHRLLPEHIVGHRGTVIKSIGRDVAPYVDWPQANKQSPAARVFLTGMGGILYPPNFLQFETTKDMSLATKLAPTADDIWFKAMSMLAGVNVSKVSDSRGDFMTVRSAQRSSLRDVNVAQGRNESQFKAVMDHFGLWDKLDSSAV